MSDPARLRLMPVVMIAAGALLTLKLAGLATQSSYLFPAAQAATAEPPSAPAAPETKGAPPPAAPQAAKSEPHGADAAESSSQKALLEALQKRRETLDARASDLELRENLLKAAEKRLEERLDELKRVETSVADVDRKRAEEEKARLKNLVTMYETMKVKEAARIFEKLDPAVLLDVASLMNPRKLSEIMGQMSPDGAQKLTVALARQEVGARPAEVVSGELPKIEGRPTPP